MVSVANLIDPWPTAIPPGLHGFEPANGRAATARCWRACQLAAPTMDKWVPLSAEKLHGGGAGAGHRRSIAARKPAGIKVLGTLPEGDGRRSSDLAKQALIRRLGDRRGHRRSSAMALGAGSAQRWSVLASTARNQRRRPSVVAEAPMASLPGTTRACRRKVLLQLPDNSASPQLAVQAAPDRLPQSPPPAVHRRPPSFTKSPSGRPASTSVAADDFGDFVQPPSFPKIAPPGKALNGHGPTRSHTLDSFGSVAFDSEPPDLNGFSLSEFDGEEIDLSAPARDGSTARPKSSAIPFAPAKDSCLAAFRSRYQTLLPFLRSLQTHSTSSMLFTDPSLTPLYRAQLIATLSRFFHPALRPPTDSFTMSAILRNLQSATDVFEGTLLSEFERCDDSRDEAGMARVAKVVWELGHGSMSVVQVFVGKREIFYDTRFNPLENIVCVTRVFWTATAN